MKAHFANLLLRTKEWHMGTKEASTNGAETSSGIEMKVVFRPEDSPVDYQKDLADPGRFPFTRGPYPSMYRGKLWTMRQYAGYATAAESNARYRYLLEQGQTGLSVAFDLPTQMGYDSDHQMARGEVGKVGVAIDTLDDMERLFEAIPLDRVSTSMTINATAAILMAMYVAVAKKQGVEPKELSGTVQNDILKEYIARGTYIYPPRPSLRIVTDIFAYSARELPRWNTISISGYHIREAGSTAAQEVAFTLGDAIAYVEAARDRGLEVDAFAPRLAFFFNSHNQFLEEVAKFRAARRMWARIMRDRFGARDPRSMALRFHAQTGGSTLTAQQPEVNIVRTAIQALAAVLGGAQSLHTNSMDEALGLPTETAARIALRTQQVIAYESGIADTGDPLGGSYAIEDLTNEIELIASDYIAKIDGMGGMLRAIEIGYVQREIDRASYDYQRAVESGSKTIVGLNRFATDDEASIPVMRIDSRLEVEQVERLRGVRARRSEPHVRQSLARIEQAAQSDQVEAHATVGEISDRLRLVFGEYHGES
jgi:methylmalonyl-CoA mutase N-terminal domain/subunit